MKDRINKILSLVKIENLKNDKRIVVFLICLFIATSLWFLNALSKNYSTTISYPVKYINPPSNQFISNTPPSKFELKVEAFGFSLLRHKLSFSLSPIVLNLTEITNNIEPNSGAYTIYTRNLISRISNQVSNEIRITDLQPDFFQIILDSLKTKDVPVELNVTSSFKPQVKLKVPIASETKKVKITGPANVLDTLFSINTEPVEFSKLDANTEKWVLLLHPEKTKITPEKILLKVEVEKFTEKELKIPIQIINKPENVKVKLFPSEIKLLFTVGLSEFDKITASSFIALVDYNLIENSMEFLEVSIEKKPEFIELLRFSPEKVEFLIETE